MDEVCFFFPPVILTVCIIRIYTTMWNWFFWMWPKVMVVAAFWIFFFFFNTRPVFVWRKSCPHVPSSQAINWSWRRSAIHGYAVRRTTSNGFIKHAICCIDVISLTPLWIGGDHVIGFWSDHLLLEVFDCKICFCIFFFLNEASVTVQMSGRNMREKGGELSGWSRRANGGGTMSHLWKCAFFFQFKASFCPIHAPQLCSQPCNNKKEKRRKRLSHISNQ